jgi:hypothetical protein
MHGMVSVSDTQRQLDEQAFMSALSALQATVSVVNIYREVHRVCLQLLEESTRITYHRGSHTISITAPAKYITMTIPI